jgi:hypothetical protein
MQNARGLGRHLAGRLAATGEAVVDVAPKLSARVRVLSSGNARKDDGVDALATALGASSNQRLAAMDPEADSEVLRLLSERRLLTWWPSVHTSAQWPARTLAGPRPRRGGREALSLPIGQRASCWA